MITHDIHNCQLERTPPISIQQPKLSVELEMPTRWPYALDEKLHGGQDPLCCGPMSTNLDNKVEVPTSSILMTTTT